MNGTYGIDTAQALAHLLFDLKFGQDKDQAQAYLDTLPDKARAIIKSIRDDGTFRINCASKESLERFLHGSGIRMLREKVEELAEVAGAQDPGIVGSGRKVQAGQGESRQGMLVKAGVPEGIAKTLLRSGSFLSGVADTAFQSEALRLGGMMDHLRRIWGVSDGLRDMILQGNISLLETGDDMLFMRDASIIQQRIGKVDALVRSVTGWERPPSSVRESVIKEMARIIGGKAVVFETSLSTMRKADEYLEGALSPQQRAAILQKDPGLLMRGIDEIRALVSGMKDAKSVVVG